MLKNNMGQSQFIKEASFKLKQQNLLQDFLGLQKVSLLGLLSNLPVCLFCLSMLNCYLIVVCWLGNLFTVVCCFLVFIASSYVGYLMVLILSRFVVSFVCWFFYGCFCMLKRKEIDGELFVLLFGFKVWDW